jgi:competence protein ComEC
MLEKFLQKSPFVRILIPLVAGILLAEMLSPFPFRPLIIAASAVLVLSVITALKGGYFRNKLSGFLFSLFFLLTGSIVFRMNTQVPVFPEADTWLALLTERPEEREASFRAEAQIIAVGRGDSLDAYSERILIYFSKADSLNLPGTGDQILFFKSPSEFQNDGNPYGFDYKSYMARREIWRQVWLPAGRWIKAGEETARGTRIQAERIRERLMAIYVASGLEGEELAILSALTLGYKKSLDPEVRQVFSESGAMHVLAVSGLHVGIIFLAFKLLFMFLKRFGWGRMVYATGAIGVLWGYAFLTGMSPSVQRAALMFSLVQAGDGLKRPSNIYNTLAASAFILLCIKPVLLFEAGFQLSYSAVLGIVYFQPKLSGLFTIKNKFGSYFMDLLMVSLAAQLGTFAVSSFYFHQFPVWFWITNLVVIPAAFVFILLAAGILLFSFFTPASVFLAMVTETLVAWVYQFLKMISNMPFSVYSGFNFNSLSLAVTLLGIFMTVMFIESKKSQYLFSLMFLLSVYFLNNAYEGFIQVNRRQLVVYQSNVPNIHLIHGRHNYLFLPGKVIESGEPFRPAGNLIKSLRLNSPVVLSLETDFEDHRVLKSGSQIIFCGKNIIFPTGSISAGEQENHDFMIDFQEQTGRVFKGTGWLVTGREPERRENYMNTHSVSKNGAFIAKF